MLNVLVTRLMVDEAMQALDGKCEVDLYEGPPDAIPRDVFLNRAKDKDGLLTMLSDRVDAELLDAAGPRLKIVANHAVGYDNIDVAECTRRGIMVANTPDVLTEATADLTWALILACLRRIAEGDRLLRARTPWIWGPRMMLGYELYGKTLGIVGFGRIGQATARRATGFGMRVIHHSRSGGHSFDEVVAESDVLSIHAPLTPETRHLFNTSVFRRMKPTAVLVNTARGPLVNEAELAEALRDKEIFAAGLDVFEREPEVEAALLDLDNVTIVPHLGSATVETRAAMGLFAVENLLAGVHGERPRGLVS